LTHWESVHEYFEITHSASIFAPHCNSITQQGIVLESCPNPQQTQLTG